MPMSNWTWIWNDFIILHSPSWSDACRSYREIASYNYNKRGSTSPKGSACLWCEKEDYAAEQLWIKAQSGGICCHSLQWGVIVAVDRQPPFHSLFHFLSVSLSHFLSLRGVMIHSTHNLKRYSILGSWYNSITFWTKFAKIKLKLIAKTFSTFVHTTWYRINIKNIQ